MDTQTRARTRESLVVVCFRLLPRLELGEAGVSAFGGVEGGGTGDATDATGLPVVERGLFIGVVGDGGVGKSVGFPVIFFDSALVVAGERLPEARGLGATGSGVSSAADAELLVVRPPAFVKAMLDAGGQMERELYEGCYLRAPHYNLGSELEGCNYRPITSYRALLPKRAPPGTAGWQLGACRACRVMHDAGYRHSRAGRTRFGWVRHARL
ncbi:hypothetical protein BDZ89DRAFT_1041010 [Hymenopellis radicata]|nr:hypothetical protein BDZ89DRAFT_1041010 [Hymenopellis radicata]